MTKKPKGKAKDTGKNVAGKASVARPKLSARTVADPANPTIAEVAAAHALTMQDWGMQQRALQNRRTDIYLEPGDPTPEQLAEIDVINKDITEILIASREYNINILAFLDSSDEAKLLADKIEGVNTKLQENLERINKVIKVINSVTAFMATANSFLNLLKAF